MESHDTGIYLNTNSTESSSLRYRRHNTEHLSADNISPDCQPSEVAAPADDNSPDSDRLWEDLKTRRSFEKTSTWLLQQDAGQNEETDVGLERATQSSSYVGSKTSDVNFTSTVTASHSAPILSENVGLSENDVCTTRSSLTVIASTPSEQTFTDYQSSSRISIPTSHTSSKQRTRQLRFLCAAADVEDCPDSKDCDVDSRTFPSENSVNDAEETDGQQLVKDGTQNDVEDLSAEDGASLADSNTSLSDTCNSSFKSSTEDLASRGAGCSNENGMPAASDAAEDTIPCVSSLHSQQSPELRHRKRRTLNDGQQTYSSSPARQCEHLRLAEVGEEDGRMNTTCQECECLVMDSGSGMQQSADAAVGELPRSTVSSDDVDDDNSQVAPRISPSKCRVLHMRHSRRQCSIRGARSNERFSGHSPGADSASKERGARVEGRRSNARMMDVRLLESTGISSADSDAEAARLSAAKSASTPKASSPVV